MEKKGGGGTHCRPRHCPTHHCGRCGHRWRRGHGCGHRQHCHGGCVVVVVAWWLWLHGGCGCMVVVVAA